MKDFDVSLLDKLIKSMSSNPHGKIGVLQDSARTPVGESNNASIGAKHELGVENMPQRSWLRMPIINYLERYLKKAGALKPEVLREIIKSGSLKPWMSKIMISAEAVVAEGFDSGGFGLWKPSNMKLKKNHQTLVETQQLRNSVTSVISDD